MNPAKSSSNDGDFCFAQLSDPHLSSLEHIEFRQLLSKRLLGYLSWKKNRRREHSRKVLDQLTADMKRVALDHVVVTGDLTHVGLPSECAEARSWLDLVGSPEDVSVIPGNHDAYVSESWNDTLGLWAPFMCSDGLQNEHGQDELFPMLRVRGSVAFIGLSSACPSPPLFATGSVGRKQLHQLAGILEATGKQKLFRVVLVHHAPVPATDKWRKRLTDGASLCAVLQEHGVELVLHGHTHRAMESRLPSGDHAAPVIGLPSASALGLRHGEPAMYQLYRVRRDGDGWNLSITSREYDAKTDGFQEVRRRTITV